MKYTKGPWTQSRLDPRCIGFINDVIEPGKQSNFHAVAQVRERIGETEGNIALIAAAPNLLGAAKQIIAWALKHDRGHEGSELLEILSETQAAITKAEGGTQ